MKKVKHTLCLKLSAHQATIAPPLGPILGPTNINLVEFCEDFNDWSKDLDGEIELGVIVYDDLSYDILSIKEFNEYKSAQQNEALSFLYRTQEEKPLKKR